MYKTYSYDSNIDWKSWTDATPVQYYGIACHYSSQEVTWLVFYFCWLVSLVLELNRMWNLEELFNWLPDSSKNLCEFDFENCFRRWQFHSIEKCDFLSNEVIIWKRNTIKSYIHEGLDAGRKTDIRNSFGETKKSGNYNGRFYMSKNVLFNTVIAFPRSRSFLFFWNFCQISSNFYQIS